LNLLILFVFIPKYIAIVHFSQIQCLFSNCTIYQIRDFYTKLPNLSFVDSNIFLDDD
jgi:hypothetical protein